MEEAMFKRTSDVMFPHEDALSKTIREGSEKLTQNHPEELSVHNF
jgi:hypothetical protein